MPTLKIADKPTPKRRVGRANNAIKAADMLTKSAIRRLAYMAGAMKVKGGVYSAVRITIFGLLLKVLSNACLLVGSRKAQTIKAEDVNQACEILGEVNSVYKPLRGGLGKKSEPLKRCAIYKGKTKSRAGKQRRSFFYGGVKPHQGGLGVETKKSKVGCVHLSKSAFSALTRAVIDGAVDSSMKPESKQVRITAMALRTLQQYAENYVVGVMYHAVEILNVAAPKNVLLDPKFLMLALVIRGELLRMPVPEAAADKGMFEVDFDKKEVRARFMYIFTNLSKQDAEKVV